MFRFSAAPRFRQSAPLLRRGRTCTPSRASRGQREPCQVKASRAQRLRDPGILCLLPVPTGIALLALAKAALAGTLGCCRRIVFAVEVSPPSPQGAPVASDEGALGAPGSGGRKPLPGERRAPVRAREGAGGAASSCAGRAGSGVDRPPRRGCPCLAAVADLCARSRWRPLGGPVCSLRASEGCAGGSSVYQRVGALCSPRRLFGGSCSGSGPKFQAVSAGGWGWGWLRWVVGGPPGAAGRGATGVLWATSPKEGNQVERVSVRALAL